MGQLQGIGRITVIAPAGQLAIEQSVQGGGQRAGRGHHFGGIELAGGWGRARVEGGAGDHHFQRDVEPSIAPGIEAAQGQNAPGLANAGRFVIADGVAEIHRFALAQVVAGGK